jgi:hypothetical protein
LLERQEHPANHKERNDAENAECHPLAMVPPAIVVRPLERLSDMFRLKLFDQSIRTWSCGKLEALRFVGDGDELPRAPPLGSAVPSQGRWGQAEDSADRLGSPRSFLQTIECDLKGFA